MINRILIILIYAASLCAYQLPKVEIDANNRPEVVIFSATSVIVKNKPSYLIRWKTLNSTDVQLTFIGKVKPEGELTVTEDEYNRGPITLTASCRGSNFSDSKTINMKNENSDDPIMIFRERESNVQTYQSYSPTPYRRRYANPHRRRHY